jgi:transposase
MKADRHIKGDTLHLVLNVLLIDNHISHLIFDHHEDHCTYRSCLHRWCGQ